MSTEPGIVQDGGIELLSGSEKEACQNLFTQLCEYGVLIVPGGELESWLKSLGTTGHGPRWLISMFEKMGDVPDDPDYLTPTGDDVWDLLGLAQEWGSDVNRKGIPVS